MTSEYFDIQGLPEFDKHEFIDFISDHKVGLKGFIVIHRGSSTFPSFGATRYWNYENLQEALRDALRLSKMMSYKCSFAGLRYVGAKGIILAGGETSKNLLLESYAKHVNFLRGGFITGSDAGLNREDVVYMSNYTPYMVGLQINPEKFTALGLLYAIKICMKKVFGSEIITSKSFAIQGLGKVGFELLKNIYPEAKKIFVSDPDLDKIVLAKREFPNILVVSPNDIYTQDVDLFAPCALSYAITSEIIPNLRCKIVAGGANNQLENDKAGEMLYEKGILYAPDYVINAGGLISVVDEYENKNPSHNRVLKKVLKIRDRMALILEKSHLQGRSPHLIANEMVEPIINA